MRYLLTREGVGAGGGNPEEYRTGGRGGKGTKRERKGQEAGISEGGNRFIKH